jgi:hypothetical protein
VLADVERPRLELVVEGGAGRDVDGRLRQAVDDDVESLDRQAARG